MDLFRGLPIGLLLLALAVPPAMASQKCVDQLTEAPVVDSASVPLFGEYQEFTRNYSQVVATIQSGTRIRFSNGRFFVATAAPVLRGDFFEIAIEDGLKLVVPRSADEGALAEVRAAVTDYEKLEYFGVSLGTIHGEWSNPPEYLVVEPIRGVPFRNFGALSAYQKKSLKELARASAGFESVGPLSEADLVFDGRRWGIKDWSRRIEFSREGSQATVFDGIADPKLRRFLAAEVKQTRAQRGKKWLATIRELVWMQAKYLGENLGRWMPMGGRDFEMFKVEYLTDLEIKKLRVQIREGKFYDAEGKLVDTTATKTARADGAGKAIFVLRPDGSFYISPTQVVGKFHHSSLAAGGPVLMAGEIVVKEGVPTFVANMSGHYLPPPEYLARFLEFLTTNGVSTKGLALQVMGL